MSKLPKWPAVGCRIKGKCHSPTHLGIPAADVVKRIGAPVRDAAESSGKDNHGLFAQERLQGVRWKAQWREYSKETCLLSACSRYSVTREVKLPFRPAKVYSLYKLSLQSMSIQAIDIHRPGLSLHFCLVDSCWFHPIHFAQSRFHVRRQGGHVHPWHIRWRLRWISEYGRRR